MLGAKLGDPIGEQNHRRQTRSQRRVAHRLKRFRQRLAITNQARHARLVLEQGHQARVLTALAQSVDAHAKDLIGGTSSTKRSSRSSTRRKVTRSDHVAPAMPSSGTENHSPCQVVPPWIANSSICRR